MKKNTQQILIALVTIAITASCQKTENKDIITVSQYYKDRYVYQPGSYWVYYDSVTGNTDSFALVSTTRYTRNGTQASGHMQYLEQFVMKTREFPAGDTTSRSSWYLQTSTAQLDVIVVNLDNNSYSSTLLRNITPTVMETTSYVSQHGVYEHNKCELLPSFTLNGATIDSIYKVIVERDSSAKDNYFFHDTFYVAGQFGLVKIVRNDWKTKSNLNLIRYKILRN